jgi:hypothetical protein
MGSITKFSEVSNGQRSETFVLGPDSPLEVFDIPSSRNVHGNSFPLGIRPKRGFEIQTIDEAVLAIKTLSQTGAFNKLLRNSE